MREETHTGVFVRKWIDGKPFGLAYEVADITGDEFIKDIIKNNEFGKGVEYHIENTYGECLAVVKEGK